MGERRNRRWSAILGAALAVPLLAGCSLVEGGGQVLELVRGDLEAHERLRTAVEEVRDLDGVAGAHFEYEPSGELGEVASIHIEAEPDATTDALIEMAQVAARAFDAEVLSGANGTTELALGAAVFTQQGIDLAPAVIADEVTYWSAVRAVLDIPISVTVVDGGAAGLQRTMTAPGDADIASISRPFLEHHGELRGVTVPPAAASVWMLPGLLLSAMPSEEIVGLVLEVEEIVPFGDFREYDPSRPDVTVDGLTLHTAPNMPFAGIQVSHNELSDADSERVLDAAIATASVDGAAFITLVSAGGGSLAQFFRGECETEVQATPADRELVVAVERSAGRNLGITPGFCSFADE
jgi:hypothetical protein